MLQDAVEILTLEGNRIKFDVEISQTLDGKFVGLSKEQCVLENFGLLKEYGYPFEPVCFNPEAHFFVDFIFCDNAGNILKIYNNANSLSDKIISCYQTSAVLEIKGGECKRLGINVGDIVISNRFDLLENKHFKPLDIEDAVYYKKYKEYWCKTSEDLYFYSHKAHCWIKLLKTDDEVFKEHHKIYDKLSETIYIDRETANREVINIDKEFAKDYRNSQKRFYWVDDTLFFQYTPETDDMEWYCYGVGWCKVKHQYNFNGKYEKLKFNSINITSIDALEKIEMIKSKMTKEEQKLLNKNNRKIVKKIFWCNDNYRKNTSYLVMFKNVKFGEHVSRGWRGGLLPGNKEEVVQICKKNKNKGFFTEYKIFNEVNRYGTIGKFVMYILSQDLIYDIKY